MQNDTKKELFESAPVPKALASLAVPTVISQLINLIYNVVDTFFIGRTGNSDMIAGVTVAFTLFMMTIAFANLFGIGGGSLIARLRGVGKDDDAKNVSAFSVWGSVAIAVIYSLLVGAFLEPLLRLLGASDATVGYASEYTLVVVVIGGLPIILSLALSHLLRNVGYSKQASIGLSGGGILNIILDPLFMFVLLPAGSEVLGAAIATTISNFASCIYLLVVYIRLGREVPLSASPKEALAVSRPNLSALFAVGVPSAVLTGLFDVANIALNLLMAAHGDSAVAAIGIVMKVERLPNAINMGICQGMLPIVAYNFASGNRTRMKQVLDTARLWGLIISAMCIVAFEIAAEPLVEVFLSTSGENPENAIATLLLAASFLRLRVAASPVQFLNYHTSFSLQAMGDGSGTLIHAIVRELVFYIPFMYMMDHFFGESGLAGALIVGEACAALFAVWLLRRWIRKVAPKQTEDVFDD